MWDASKCDYCGDCLVKCQFTNYDVDQSVAELELLIEGKKAEILEKCVTCCACNEYCPTNAEPFDLILKSIERNDSFPIEKEIVDTFEDIWTLENPGEITIGDTSKPVLSLCVMDRILKKDVIESQLFDGMGIASGGDYFCRFGYMHIGKESPIRENAEMFLNNLSRLEREIVFLHDDCFSMVDVMSKNYGLKIHFKYMHILEYMRNYLRDNKSKIKNLDIKVAYQRPCASRYTPEKEKYIDEIFELLGAKRPKRKFEKENALCCSAPITRIDSRLAHNIRALNMDDAVECGADALITLCPMCDKVLTWATAERDLEKILIIDLCKMALGEIELPEKLLQCN